MAAEQARNLSLDGLRQKRARAVAQNLGQRIGKSSRLRELENISVGHGVSLLCWRSGGLEHPHDTPPHPFMPSPNLAHSSPLSLPNTRFEHIDGATGQELDTQQCLRTARLTGQR